MTIAYRHLWTAGSAATVTAAVETYFYSWGLFLQTSERQKVEKDQPPWQLITSLINGATRSSRILKWRLKVTKRQWSKWKPQSQR